MDAEAVIQQFLKELHEALNDWLDEQTDDKKEQGDSWNGDHSQPSSSPPEEPAA